MDNTVGIIGGILGILAFAGQFIRWVTEIFKNIRPFKITLSRETRDKIRRDSDMTSNIQIPIGETRILIRTKTRLPTNLTETFIRPENKNRKDVFKKGEEPLKIERVEVVDERSPKFDVILDNIGGVKLFYNELYERPQGVNIHYYLTIKATKRWIGKLMVSATVNSKRGYAYGDIEIVDG